MSSSRRRLLGAKQSTTYTVDLCAYDENSHLVSANWTVYYQNSESMWIFAPTTSQGSVAFITIPVNQQQGGGTLIRYSVTKEYYKPIHDQYQTINQDDQINVNLIPAQKITVTVTPTLNPSGSMSDVRVLVNDELIVPDLSTHLIQFQEYEDEVVNLTIVKPHYEGISESVTIINDGNNQMSINKTLLQTTNDQYLSMMQPNGGTIKLKSDTQYISKSIFYSADNGVSWQQLDSDKTPDNPDDPTKNCVLDMVANKTYIFTYNDEEVGADGNITYGGAQDFGYLKFVSDTQTYIWGNLGSLIPETQTTLKSYALAQMFNGNDNIYNHPKYELYLDNITSAGTRSLIGTFSGCDNITRPVVLNISSHNPTSADGVFHSLFSKDYNLRYSPYLLIDVLNTEDYTYLFNNRNLNSKLKYIFCYATDISNASCLNYWITGLENNPITFYCATGMKNTWEGVLPSGWTIIEGDPYNY